MKNLISVISIAMLIFTIAFTNEKEDWTKAEDAVVLSDENIFIITDENEGIFKKNISIKINNEKGKDLCNFVLVENQFVSIDNIEGFIKDTLGNEIKELDDDDINETSFTFGTTLHSDDIKKYFALDHYQYPFIISVSYELEINSLIFWPGWQPHINYPILNSSYKLIMETPVNFNIFTKGINKKPEKFTADDDSVYFWQLDSIPAQPDEPYMDPEDKIQYKLLFSPIYFSLDEISGSLQSWESFAEWNQKLFKDKYTLNPKIKKEIDEILNPASTDLEKIQILYDYLKNKTRYVAIQLGIGGWEPYSALEVYESRYGDCKDLSTFMIAILKHAGIKAYPAIIKTRDKGIINKEFPIFNFNHVITCVPLEKDTLWLEVTADHLLAGDLPWSDEDCNVVIVTDSSGHIVTTPKSNSHDNAWQSKISGEFNKKGDFVFNGKVRLFGNQRHYIARKHISYKQDDFKDWLLDRIGEGIPGFNLDNYSFIQAGKLKNSNAVLAFDGCFNKFGKKMGSRLFINPNILNIRSHTAFEKEDERLYPIHLSYAYMNIDTVSIKLPYGYTIEAAPDQLNLETSFAKYQSDYNVNNDIFTYIRHFEYKTNHIPAEQYDQVVKFTNSVIKNDQIKYVFKKK